MRARPPLACSCCPPRWSSSAWCSTRPAGRWSSRSTTSTVRARRLPVRGPRQLHRRLPTRGCYRGRPHPVLHRRVHRRGAGARHRAGAAARGAAAAALAVPVVVILPWALPTIVNGAMWRDPQRRVRRGQRRAHPARHLRRADPGSAATVRGAEHGHHRRRLEEHLARGVLPAGRAPDDSRRAVRGGPRRRRRPGGSFWHSLCRCCCRPSRSCWCCARSRRSRSSTSSM